MNIEGAHSEREIKEFSDEIEKTLLEVRESVCQVFKSYISTIVRDSRLLDKVKSPPLLHVLDLNFKETLLGYYFKKTMKLVKSSPVLGNHIANLDPLTSLVNVRRSYLLEDTVRAIDLDRPLLLNPSRSLQIIFTNERMAIKARQEWLTLTIDELVNPEKGLFVLSHNQRSVLPSFQSFLVPNSLHLFRITGNIIGIVLLLF